MDQAIVTGGVLRRGSTLKELLVRHTEFLTAFLRRRAQGLLLHETIEDLLQGI